MLLFFSVALAAGCDTLDAAESQRIAAQLEAGFEGAQKGQDVGGLAPAVRELDAAGKLCSPLQRAQAAAVLDSGFDPDQTRRAHELATEAWEAGEALALGLIPTTWDRMQIAQHLPQRYATLEGRQRQLTCLYRLDPAPDDERLSFGLEPLAERPARFGVASVADLEDDRRVCRPPESPAAVAARRPRVGLRAGVFSMVHTDLDRPLGFGPELLLVLRPQRATMVMGVRTTYIPTVVPGYEAVRAAVRFGLLTPGIHVRAGVVGEFQVGFDVRPRANPTFGSSALARVEWEIGPLYLAPEAGVRIGMILDQDYFAPLIQGTGSLAVGFQL